MAVACSAPGPEEDALSEFAQGIAAIVGDLPEATAKDLHRLLRHHVGAPTPAELRERRLGLLLEMVADQSGVVPGTADYEQRRKEPRPGGETFPSASALIRAYGSWSSAVKAAMRAHQRGSRVPNSYAHAHHYKRYTRSECLWAIQRCALALGQRHEDGQIQPNWEAVTQWIYDEWARLTRAAARNAGKPDPRNPGLPTIRKRLGPFDRAATAARGDWEASGS